MRKRTVASIGGLLACAVSAPAFAGITVYTDRATFEAALGGNYLIDGFDAAGYLNGDRSNGGTLDIHSNASMSGVLGEADFMSTGFSDWNFVLSDGSGGNTRYCAGCNGSFQLGFTTTSYGTGAGVYGAGFDVTAGTDYYAFVTLGNSETHNIALSGAPSFFGVISDDYIASIHVGLSGGGSTTGGYIEIDNLTYGGIIPAPAAIALFGLAGLCGRRRRA